MRVLVLGDLMVDQYTYVKTLRRAAEAPIPVWDEVRTEVRPGGAANLARNLKIIGGDDVEVDLCGIIGGVVGDFQTMIKNYNINTDFVVAGATMIKHRFVADGRTDNQYLFRHDNFLRFPDQDTEWFENIILERLRIEHFDAIVVSDYDKGTVTPGLARALVTHQGFTIVDSKRQDLSIFDGFNVLKMNEPEWSVQVSSKLYENYAKFFEYCVVTHGADGAVLHQCDRVKSTEKRYVTHIEKFPTEPLFAVDVTGCGDTFTAGLTVGLLRNRDVRMAIRIANMTAGKVVQKFGTETP